MSTDGSEAADEVVRLEQELLLTASRQSEDRLNEVLDAGFLEFGASGRRWSRDAVIEALLDEAPPLEGRMMAVEVSELAAGVLLLTYQADVEDRRSLRSSVWMWRGGEWRLRFHQVTPLPPDAD